MSILVLAEHDGEKIKSATLRIVGAVRDILGEEITLLIAGENVEVIAKAASKIEGVVEVLYQDDPASRLIENMADTVSLLASHFNYVVAASTGKGKYILPRVAAMHDCSMIADVLSIVSSEVFEHSIYSGSAIERVRSYAKIKFLTLRPTLFPEVSASGGNASIRAISSFGDNSLTAFIDSTKIILDRPELMSARVVVSGGRGLQSAEEFRRVIEPLADKLGAAIGATRAAVDSGFAPSDYQVGQTGKVVAPKLYIAIGISGAIQHLAGMKDSEVIVAINNDPDAPIFEIADYGLVEDYRTAIPALSTALNHLKFVP